MKRKLLKAFLATNKIFLGVGSIFLFFVLLSFVLNYMNPQTMTKKEIIKKLNKEYPKLLKNINNKKISQKDKKKLAMEFTKFLEELADNTPNDKQFSTKRK